MDQTDALQPVLNEFKKMLIGGIVAYMLLVPGAWYFQRHLIYVTNTQHVVPAQAGLDAAGEVMLARPDGARLVAWYQAARPGQQTLLYFHGNGGNLAVRSGRMKAFVHSGRGMLMLAYRGYSGSTGQPSEQANIGDAVAAYDWLVAKGVAPSRIVVYGESLGTGVAVQVAGQRDIGGLVLEAPFTSLVAVAKNRAPFLPVDWLLEDRYETLNHLSAVRVPLLIIHGEKDTLIPVAMGRAVYRSAGTKKRLKVLPEAGHNDLYAHGAFDHVMRWLEELGAKQVAVEAR